MTTPDKESSTTDAFETMREALILAEKADRIHSKCQECEDLAQAPEACGDCFPSADDARVARRNVLKSLGVRMRDVDRAALSTLPVNDRHHSENDNERLREALALGREAAKDLASIMREGAHDAEEIKWCRVVDKIDAALKGVTQPATEAGKLSTDAALSAPSTEKVRG